MIGVTLCVPKNRMGDIFWNKIFDALAAFLEKNKSRHKQIKRMIVVNKDGNGSFLSVAMDLSGEEIVSRTYFSDLISQIENLALRKKLDFARQYFKENWVYIDFEIS